MITIYILYTPLSDKYYIGFTGDTLKTRLKKHLAHHKGFTAKQSDWKVVHTEVYDNKQAAMQREKEIKNWKSRKMIGLN